MSDPVALDQLPEPLLRVLAQRIAEFRIAAAVGQRMSGLLTKRRAEREQALINATDFVDILKLKARRGLASHDLAARGPGCRS
jgi:hypothetical protein